MEEMAAFFARRVEEYDRHMREEVEGCREGYERMAQLLPGTLSRLLDLGCGTGLELETIFARFPQLEVTAIDLSNAMLQKARAKFPGRRLRLIQGDYLQEDFGAGKYDAAVSFQTLHHFDHDQKRALYTRIRRALKEDGVYLEGDYMVERREEEEAGFARSACLRREQGIPEGTLLHLDTPCAVDTQIRLLREAGFARVESVLRRGNTTLLMALRRQPPTGLPGGEAAGERKKSGPADSQP